MKTRKWKRQSKELLGESRRPHWPYLTMALGELRSQSAISPYEEEEVEFDNYEVLLLKTGNGHVAAECCKIHGRV